MVRKPERHLITACLATLVAVGLAASCTEGEGLPATTGDDAPSITFTTPQTRAAVTGADDMDAFSVWAWKDDGGKVFPVDDALLVENTGSGWEYDPRYLTRWEEDKMYDFYALYPEQSVIEQNGSTTVSCDENGTITITNYNATNELDLMTATVSDRPGAEGGKVGFTFGHMLAKVSVVATVDGGNATVTAISLSGPVKGSYDGTAWTADTGSSTKVVDKSGQQITLGTNETELAGGMLLIPQSPGNFTLQLTYTLDGKEESYSGSLSTSNVPTWEANGQYKYKLTIKGNNIIFTANVVQWNTSTGGIITIE